jgi:peptide/nickel transport system substrate-binding protein
VAALKNQNSDRRKTMVFDNSMSRRAFLTKAGQGALLLGSAGALAACGSSGTTSPTTSSVSGRPKTGGTIKAGLSGGSTADTLNALTPVQSTDFARTLNLFEPLTIFGANGPVENVLAKEVTPNKDATTWTIRLRPGITWHNGKPLTADDVIYTLQVITNPKAPMPGATALTLVDVKGLKKLDPLTVSVPCTRPLSVLPQALAAWYLNVVPVGYDPQHPPKHPIGTGPFKFKSFTPGLESVFVRNENYWESGLPYVDTLVITDVADESSQVNALISGDVDVIDLLSFASIAPVQSGGQKVVVSKTSAFTPIYMDRSKPPFNDVRVSQAMRLCCDRPQMLKEIFGGEGTIGNDVFAIASPDYDHAIPQRHQDIPQAKYLLKQAGREHLTVTLLTAPIAQGTVELAEVFAQNASLAGANISLNRTTPGVEFGPGYPNFLFGQDYVIYTGYIMQVAFNNVPGAPYYETHFHDAHYLSLYNEALSTVDAAKRYEIEHEMQLVDWNSGGDIVAYFYPTIDGHSPQVQGIHTSVTGWPLGGFDFKSMWLS